MKWVSKIGWILKISCFWWPWPRKSCKMLKIIQCSGLFLSCFFHNYWIFTTLLILKPFVPYCAHLWRTRTVNHCTYSLDNKKKHSRQNYSMVWRIKAMKSEIIYLFTEMSFTDDHWFSWFGTVDFFEIGKLCMYILKINLSDLNDAICMFLS